MDVPFDHMFIILFDNVSRRQQITTTLTKTQRKSRSTYSKACLINKNKNIDRKRFSYLFFLNYKKKGRERKKERKNIFDLFTSTRLNRTHIYTRKYVGWRSTIYEVSNFFLSTFAFVTIRITILTLSVIY